MTEAPTAPAFGLSRPTLTFYTPIIVAFAGQTLAELRESPAGLTLLDRSRWYDEYPAELLAPAGRYEVLLAVDESVGLDEDLQLALVAGDRPGWHPTPVAVGLAALLTLVGNEPTREIITFRMAERLPRDGRLQLCLRNGKIHVESRTARTGEPATYLSVCRLLN